MIRLRDKDKSVWLAQSVKAPTLSQRACRFIRAWQCRRSEVQLSGQTDRQTNSCFHPFGVSKWVATITNSEWLLKLIHRTFDSLNVWRIPKESQWINIAYRVDQAKICSSCHLMVILCPVGSGAIFRRTGLCRATRVDPQAIRHTVWRLYGLKLFWWQNASGLPCYL